MTETITNRHAITNSLGLIATTNGCIDMYGGLDIQFSLVVEPDGDAVWIPIPLAVAKQIHLSTETDDDRHAHGDEGKWFRFYSKAESAARKLRLSNPLNDYDMPF